MCVCVRASMPPSLHICVLIDTSAKVMCKGKNLVDVSSGLTTLGVLVFTVLGNS
jgi:hypothetical protein